MTTSSIRLRRVGPLVSTLGTALALLAFVACGGDSTEGDPSKLNAEEQAYADQIAAASDGTPFTAGEKQCIGTQSVRTFGLSRAKQLELASKNTPPVNQADAEKLADILDNCVGLTGFFMRSANSSLGLSSSQVEICAGLLDKAKVRRLIVEISMMQKADDEATAAVKADLTSVLARCS